MGEILHKPPLGADVYEEILMAQYEVDKVYWPRLNEMRIPPLALVGIFASPHPPLPRQPVRLCRIIGEYACALFDVEAQRYPTTGDLEIWLNNLAKRIEAKVIAGSEGNVLQGTLTYHATEEQIRKATREALQPSIDARLGHAGKALERVSPRLNAAPSENSEIERRKKLLAEYKAAASSPSNKKIYESRNSGIHKPQFYEWIKGTLAPDSATCKNFERFLAEKKPPIPRKSKN